MGIIINPCQAGAHSFEPKAMLKLIVYGYSYGIRSSRKLERACYHNLSFMWLISGVLPDYRTIARFRSDNKEAIKLVLKQNVKLCVKLGLIEGNTLFLDGSKFRANASKSNTWDEERCRKSLEIAEKNIERIMEEAEQIDEEEAIRCHSLTPAFRHMLIHIFSPKSVNETCRMPRCGPSGLKPRLACIRHPSLKAGVNNRQFVYGGRSAFAQVLQ